ncbi:hypothetical protein SMICM304S_04371 [Streptomyces microflavus]
MSRPVIGISTYQDPARWGVWEMPAVLLPAAYPRLVRAAGGLAVLLPPDEAADAARETVAALDGVVIAGERTSNRRVTEPLPTPVRGPRPVNATPGNSP